MTLVMQLAATVMHDHLPVHAIVSNISHQASLALVHSHPVQTGMLLVPLI
jgi:hypothetical protein